MLAHEQTHAAVHTLVLQSRVKRVVIAMIDPNPRVSGDGIKTLRKAGIGVRTGVLETEAKKLNEAYLKYIKTCTPFVALKIAQTLEARSPRLQANRNGSPAEARIEGRRRRNSNDAILVGINTVLKDNPSLTTRLPGGRDPIRGTPAS